jgi:NAD(P)H-hydrate epimerase
VVDALYGIKFRGSLEGVEAEAVQKVKAQKAKSDLYVVSLDLPSGVVCDTGIVNGPAFESDLTVTFQCWKPLHFNFPGAKLSGERVVVDIGIQSEGVPERQLITPELIKNMESLLVSSFGHKGVRGHLVVCAGSPGHSGAAALSSRAGLRAGAGLVTLVSDKETAKIAVEFTPEVMTCEASASDLEQLTKIKNGAVVVGPGLGKDSAAFEFILSSFNNLPLVVDAAALQMLAIDSKLKSKLPSDSILTPHPGEMAVLLETTTSEILRDRFASVKEAVSRYGCAVLLKGAYSIVGFTDGQVFVSPFANANLGTAGSGDVLSGLIGGLLSRGLSIKTASLLAVYLHGKIGSSLLAEGVVGSLASEFADKFPTFLSDLICGEECIDLSSFPKIL